MGKERIHDDEKNLIGGLEFIDILVKKMMATSNKEWFGKQAAFTNSILRTANQDVELYKRVKDAVKNRR